MAAACADVTVAKGEQRFAQQVGLGLEAGFDKAPGMGGKGRRADAALRMGGHDGLLGGQG